MVNTDKLIEACQKLYNRTVTVEGHRHGSAWLFDQCMRAFDYEPAKSVNFSVFLNAPVMKDGLATIDREGNLTIRSI